MKKITWYNNLGFYDNPFSIKPGAFHYDMFGYDNLIEDISSKVLEGEVIHVYGKYGTGKTSIMKGIINRFKGLKRVIYYSCNHKDESIDFDKLLIKSGNIFHKLFSIRKKNMILLLDEAQDMNNKDISLIHKYHSLGFFKSIMLVSSEKNINPTKELKDLIGNNVYKLENINEEQAIELIRKRIGDLQFVSDDSIVKIFNMNKNPRAFLKNCEEICRIAFLDGAKNVEDSHIKKVA